MTRRNLFTTLFAGVLFPRKSKLPWRSTGILSKFLEFDLGSGKLTNHEISVTTLDLKAIQKQIPQLVKAVQDMQEAARIAAEGFEEMAIRCDELAAALEQQPKTLIDAIEQNSGGERDRLKCVLGVRRDLT